MKPMFHVSERIQAMRRWTFRWRGLDGTPFPGLMATIIVAAVFAFFAATLRIRVNAPQQWVERKASIMHLPAEGEGRIWALRAQEGGPFPAKFEPVEWAKSLGTDELLAAATRLPPVPYEPKLRELPAEDGIPSLAVAEKGQRVFPKRVSRNDAAPAAGAVKLVPLLYPLSGISFQALPKELPPFTEPVDALMTAASWRFVVRLRADGSVSECVPLVNDRGGDVLAKWLKGVTFSPEAAKQAEWIGIGVGFANQPAHGPDAR